MAVRAVPCVLGGKEYHLRLDMGAMAALEDRGFELEALNDYFASGKFSPKRIQAFVWACCQGADDPPSIKDIGRWVDGENFVEVLGKVREVLSSAFPKSKEPPGPRRGAGTGVKSSASPTVPSL